ncbi:MAG: S8 family peptidase [Elusimicrobiota bacterium]|jgi:subtilisin
MFLNIAAAFVLGAFAFVPYAAAQATARPGIRQQTPTQIVTFSAQVPPQERRRLVEAAGAVVVRELPFIDALVVRMPAFHPDAVQLVAAAPGVEGYEDNVYRKWIELAAPSLSSVEIPSVSEVLRTARANADIVPKAPLITGEVPWGISRVHAPQTWTRTQGAGVKVGVIDTGVDCTHPDLRANCAGGYNVLDPTAKPVDDQGHGTHVAGTIAAVKDGQGVVGVAPKARIYAIKVLDAEGGGSIEGIIQGLQWAAENRMQVVNMSLGGPGTAALKKAVVNAYKAGVTIVAAAGNDPNAPVSAPAQYPQSIAVSASTIDDKLAFFSTTGPEVAVIGPGHEIMSCKMGGGTTKMSGTSMATPHIAGLAALAVAAGASSPSAVRAALVGAAEKLPALTATQQGAGMPLADNM